MKEGEVRTSERDRERDYIDTPLLGNGCCYILNFLSDGFPVFDAVLQDLSTEYMS